MKDTTGVASKDEVRLIKELKDRAETTFNASETELERVSESFSGEDISTQFKIMLSFGQRVESDSEKIQRCIDSLKDMTRITTATGRLPRELLKKCVTYVTSKGHTRHQPEMKESVPDGDMKVRLFELFEKNDKEMRTFIFLGKTGMGKTTHINSLFNHIIGVDYEDKFRFELVKSATEEEESHRKNSSASMTSWISVYRLYWQKGMRVNYSVTVVDTPGFGDTKGRHVDEKTGASLRYFFNSPVMNPTNKVAAINFLMKEGTCRLDQTEEYIVNKSLSLLAKDMQCALHLVVTAGRMTKEEPNAVETARNSGMLFDTYYLFDNDLGGTREVFEARDGQFKIYFEHFREDNSVSTERTVGVLNDQDELARKLKKLEEDARQYVTKLTDLKVTADKVSLLKKEEAETKDFDIERKKVVAVKVKNKDKDQCIRNCMNCERTCHHCRMVPAWWFFTKHSCTEFDDSVFCPICKCPLHEHTKDEFTYRHVTITVIESYKAMQKRYGIKQADGNKKGKLLQKLLDEFKEFKRKSLQTHKEVAAIYAKLKDTAMSLPYLKIVDENNISLTKTLMKDEESNPSENHEEVMECLNHLLFVEEKIGQCMKDAKGWDDLPESDFEKRIKRQIDELGYGGKQ